MTKGKMLALYTVHKQLLFYSVSCFFITIWTLLRFLTQRIIFDTVGQQVITQQWLHGSFGTVDIGPTNYIFKMLFIYAPLQALPGSPRFKLILLTMLVNIATFVLLAVLLQKILRLYGIRATTTLRIGLLWLAGIVGSVFWIGFINSRNLEVVGGVFLLYIGLRYIDKPSWRRLLGITGFAAVLFFADTLQLYMTAVPLVVYGALIAVKKRQQLLSVVYLAGCIIVGYIGSKLLFALASHFLKLHFLVAGGSGSLSIGHSIIGSAKSILHLYAGGADAGRLREVCNVLFGLVLGASTVYAVIRKLVPRRLVLLAVCILVVDVATYIVSGQAQHPDTERYLIMTAPAILLLAGSCYKLPKKFRNYMAIATCLVVVINAVALSSALLHIDKHFAPDKHLDSVSRFMSAHPTTVPFASMDTALPMAYLTGSDARAPLPLSCSGSTLSKNKTFYTEPAFTKRLAGTYSYAAIILDGTAIMNTPSLCDGAAITTEFGLPLSTQRTDDGSLVFVYPRSIVSRLTY